MFIFEALGVGRSMGILKSGLAYERREFFSLKGIQQLERLMLSVRANLLGE